MFKRDYAVVFLLLAGLVFVTYFNSLDSSFHYDDSHSLVSNRNITSISNIPKFFIDPHMYSGTESANHYRPIVLTTYAIDYYFGGLDPRGYNFVNVIFHILACFSLFLMVFAVTSDKTCSILAAVVFAVNPFNTEAVNYISARAVVLASIFSALSVYFHILFRKKTKKSYYVASILCLFLGLASKEAAIMTLALFVCYDLYFWKDTAGTNKALTFVIPYIPFVMGGAFYILRNNVIRFLYAIFSDRGTRSFYSNLLTQSVVTLKYIKLFFFPFGLSIDHNIKVAKYISEPQVAVSLLVHAALFGIIIYWFKKCRSASFFLLYFYIASLPTIIIPLNILLFENRGYFPGMGLAALAGIFAGSVYKEENTRRFTVAVILCYCLFSVLLSVERNRVWLTEETLWKQVLKQNPASFKAYASIGAYYQEAGERAKAIEQYEKAIDINPTYFIPYIKIGVIYHHMKKFTEAENMYKAALAINSDYPAAHYNLGVIYHMSKKYDLAISAYKRTIQINPRHVMAHYNLGNIYIDTGKMMDAVSEFQQALRLDASFTDAYYNIATVYDTIGKKIEAIENYEKFISMAPPEHESHVKLAQESIQRLQMVYRK